MVKKNTKGLIPLLVGVLLLLMVLNGGDSARSVPLFDDDTTQDFRIELLSHDSSPDAGNPTDIEIRVDNRGEDGTMFVQCSILNTEEEGAFLLTREASVDFLEGDDPNCVNPEPFTQTAEVFLEHDNQTDIIYTVMTPTDEDGDYQLFCEAFEKCWSADSTETYMTDYVARSVDVQFDSPEAINATGDNQTGVFGGLNVGEIDVDLSNTAIRRFMQENSLAIILVAIMLMIFGAVIVYGRD